MSSDDLFGQSQAAYRPLADRLRPQLLDGFFGQQHLLQAGMPLRAAIEQGKLHSMIFWGPPGTGKTTLAQMISQQSDARFIKLSAVLSGVKDIRAAVDEARLARQQSNRLTVLFIDEVHRFNKSQQDAFLPHVEDGSLIFIGATTENPSFELNNALLSRARVYVLKPLDQEALQQVLQRALQDKELGLGAQCKLDEAAREMLLTAADGDARRLLNLLEIAIDLSSDNGLIDSALMSMVAGEGTRRFDKGGEAFYDQISALHKSVRGSAPDAALYWLCRMLDGGADPLYLARRVLRMASEDIGNADPRALQICLNAWDTQQRLGSPEGELALAQAVLYLACAPKSNAVYSAFNKAMQQVRKQPSYEVPVHLRNAPTQLMKSLDYGKAYRYAHDEPHAYAAGENYFPDDMRKEVWYKPVERGLEAKIQQRLAYYRELDQQAMLAKGQQERQD
ncbi:MAG: replication-associated recombination protein A [gamma proteobacterium symbiont of Bathyaustriella thionipta]|nr:replication-associated recombination protein A [gamma proteobacterium symbiont of Bathyaustriella thionipta]